MLRSPTLIRRLATGVETIQRKAFKADAARLLAIATERNAAGFVLGLPINMDGSEGPRAQSTRAFARNFSKLTELAVALWDERLSTVAVERELIGMDMSRARRAEVIDEHAAIFILQGRPRPAGETAREWLRTAIVNDCRPMSFIHPVRGSAGAAAKDVDVSDVTGTG